MSWFGKKDDRSDDEKNQWKAGEFTESEAADMGMTTEEANRVRAEEERKAGNPLAPPE